MSSIADKDGEIIRLLSIQKSIKRKKKNLLRNIKFEEENSYNLRNKSFDEFDCLKKHRDQL
jgi:hypothetical protein